MNASAQQTLDELYPTVPFDANATVQPPSWLVEGMFLEHKFNALFGYEKSGKSRMLRWALLHMLYGIPLFGTMSVASPKRVLWLAGEEPPDDIMAGMLRQAVFIGKDRAAMAAMAERVDLIAAPGMRLDLPTYRQWLAAKIAAYDLLIIDPLRRVHGADENDNTIMSQLFNDMRQWTNTLGVSIILVHHTPKLHEGADMDRIATWSRGASDLAAVIDAAVLVERFAKDRVRIRRQGRYTPLRDIKLVDGNDATGVFELGE